MAQDSIDQAVKGQILAAIRSNQATPPTPTDPPPQAPEHVRNRPPRGKRERAECSTGKARFPTEALARDRLEQILEGMGDPNRSSRAYRPVNVQHCRKCCGWHLTSKEMKVWKHGKPRR